jgi:hypothetical protein
MYYVRQEARQVTLRFAARQSCRGLWPGPRRQVRDQGLLPVIVSVSGNVVGCSCFRILLMSCGVWSSDVHGRIPPWSAVVTRLVTHLGKSSQQPNHRQAVLTVWLTPPEAVGRQCS